MSRKSFRRVLAPVIAAASLAAIVTACGIPTEDQPQPINREQTTTTVASNP